MSGLAIAVIGAGIVGVSTACYLLRDGHRVTLVDRDGPGEGASKGNAGAISPGSCVPLAMPGTLAKVPQWLLDPDGPLVVRPSYFPRAAPWLLRFALAGRESRISAIANALRALHALTFDSYAPLLANARAGHLIRRSGCLVVYRSRQAFEASAREWAMRRERGVRVEALDAVALRQMEPALSPALACGVFLPEHGYTTDPYRLVMGLADRFVADGGAFRKTEVRGLRVRAGNGVELVTADGTTEGFKKVILAAGAWSGTLAAMIGMRLPLETQRGYHVTLADAGIAPRIPIASAEGKFYVTPMEGGLRAAGTVEFAGLHAAPDFSRARRLLAQLKILYPEARTETFSEWMGHRPCFPDSLPVIGPVPGIADVILAFGHGHNGMTSGPVTGRLIADIVAGRVPPIDLGPYRPDRF